MLKIISVVGARPNFIKIGPFARAIAALDDSGEKVIHTIVHTGQHYDERMSNSFFRELDIPEPDINLGIGSGSHAEQVGRTMIAFESVLRERRPDWVVVVGDVNATCACSITAKKEHVRLAHIEAGLRSRDMDMPEEINRLVTDRLSDLLFTTDEISSANLRMEGTDERRIRLVGNIMIDTLERERAHANRLNVAEVLRNNSLSSASRRVDSAAIAGDFAVITMHRPSNVDHPETLGAIVNFIVDKVAQDLLVVWPMHPRTRARLEANSLWERIADCSGVCLLHPIGYREMLKLNMDARLMFTDSGGLQEESCVLGTPCLTLRWNTERPITLREHAGSCVLVGNSIEQIAREYRIALNSGRKHVRPPLWDGQVAKRIVDEIVTAGAGG